MIRSSYRHHQPCRHSQPQRHAVVYQASRSPRGFTLVELIVGIVTLGLTFVILSVIIFPQAQRSAEPVLQARAASLGQAILDEIMSKGFDHNSDFSGGALRCGETGAPACTDPILLGPEGEVRDQFNDVDDYHQLEVNFPTLEDALGTDLAERYPNFQFAVTVCYATAEGECEANITAFKRVTVTITTPLGQDFQFSAIRGNY